MPIPDDFQSYIANLHHWGRNNLFVCFMLPFIAEAQRLRYNAPSFWPINSVGRAAH